MAKDSDKKAAAFEAEQTGMLSGLLADEKEFDRRALWRIGWWGTAAIGTVVAAVLANQGAQSWRQDRISAADLARLQSLARDGQNERRQLTAAIETLNNDRDRLFARVTVLEQGLESVTGTLAKQGALQPAGKPQAAATQAPSQSPGQAPSQGATADAQQPGPSSAGPGSLSGAPTIPSVATTDVTINDRTRADTGKSTGAPSTAPSLAQSPSATSLWAMAAPITSNPPSSGASLVAPQSIMAPPDPAASKLIESDKAAKSGADIESKPEPKSEAKADTNSEAAPQTEANAGVGESSEAAAAPVQKTEFAVDLGSANSVNGLRALWRGLIKSHRELAALSPIIMVKEGSAGLGMQIRLGAGPLNDAAAAARICANLAERQRPCETTVFDGQRLATRDNETGPQAARQPAASGQKPASNTNANTATQPNQRRRVWSQQHHGAVREPPPAPPPTAAAPPAEPPKPEPNTLSSLFHRSQPQ